MRGYTRRPSRIAAGLAVAVFAAICITLGILRVLADSTVSVKLPKDPITINGQQWENLDAAYPLLTYHGVTYLPSPAAGSLGLRMERSPEGGLAISLTGIAEDYAPEKRGAHNPKRDSAAVLDCPITVAGELYDDANAAFPFLEYRGVPYLPLTEALCTGPLCLDSAWNDDTGLSLHTTGRLRAPTDALPRFILHMGGVTADGQTDTNSIEAADHSYSEGYRWLEIDFNWTSDDALVCIHDWGNWRRQNGVQALDRPLSLEEFERVSAANTTASSFTPALLDSWLKEHPGAMIVTDVKDDNVRAMQWLAEHYPDLRDRLIVQIYSIDEYAPIRALGYDNIILTMYRIPWAEYRDFDQLTAFIGSSRVLAVTIAAEDNVRDVFDYLIDTGIPVYVYTLDKPKDQLIWLARGAYGIYTDLGDVRAAAG